MYSIAMSGGGAHCLLHHNEGRRSTMYTPLCAGGQGVGCVLHHDINMDDEERLPNRSQGGEEERRRMLSTPLQGRKKEYATCSVTRRRGGVGGVLHYV